MSRDLENPASSADSPSLHFVELLLIASGRIFEATRYANLCEVSRPTTINNYLCVLETTYVARVLRPFSTRESGEVVAAPDVYGFDTGFIAYFKGWHHPRPDGLETLWEHYVLNEGQARLQSQRLNYWRDTRGPEIDFVCVRRGQSPVTIECEWSADGFDPAGLKAFGLHYPKAEHFVVAHDVDCSVSRRYGDLEVTFVGLESLVKELAAPR